jgi:hypothetical protein
MSLESYNFWQSTLIENAEEPLPVRQELPENHPFKITDALQLSPEASTLHQHFLINFFSKK